MAKQAVFQAAESKL